MALDGNIQSIYTDIRLWEISIMGCQKTFNLTVVHWHREHNDFQGSTLADPRCRLHWNDGLVLSLRFYLRPDLQIMEKDFCAKQTPSGSLLCWTVHSCWQRTAHIGWEFIFYSHVGRTKVNQTLFPVVVHFTPCFHSLSLQLFTSIDFSWSVVFCSLAPQFWVQCIIITMTVFLLQNIK